MDWLADLQTSLREPVFGFLGSTWQYLVLAAIGLGWYALYSNARRSRLAAPADGRRGRSTADAGTGAYYGTNDGSESVASDRSGAHSIRRGDGEDGGRDADGGAESSGSDGGGDGGGGD